MTRPGGRVVVIGVGNEYRRDDGVGPHVVARLRGRVPPGVELVVSDGEPADMLEAWERASLALVVDAVRAVPPVPGRLHRVVLDTTEAGPGTTVSSHGLGVEAAAALAAALGRLPACLIVHAVEVADTSQGVGLTPEVAAAADALAAAVLRDLTSPT